MGDSGDVRATRFTVGDDELAVISFPLPDARNTPLSRAEMQVAALMALGLSNAEIARRRGRSIRTVANQVASILRKLGARSRVEATARLVSGSLRDEAGE